MLVSIIIPIYNVEKYIEKCLISCLNQKNVSNTDYEIILVNDGTKDKSMEVVKHVLSKNEKGIQVKIIYQENSGLSVARNVGVEQASGKYIWFVDSDDWIDENSINHIKEAINEEEEIDVLQIQFKLVFENNKEKSEIEYTYINGVMSGKDCMMKRRLPNLAQSRIINIDFWRINNLQFKPGILHEDAEFKPRTIWLAKSIKSIPHICYYYLKRNTGSITSHFTRRNAEGRIIGAQSMHEFSKGFPLEEQKAFNADINFNLYFAIHNYPLLTSQEKPYVLKDLKGLKDIYKRIARQGNLKYSIIYSIIWLSPTLSLNLYDFMYKIRNLFCGKEESNK